MSYIIRYSNHIDWKRFKKIPARERLQLKKAIENKLMTDPYLFGKPLRKSLSGCRSLRVGDYRIIYTIDGKTVEVLLFGHRSMVYDDAQKIV